jgi:hypothetical protein
MAIRAELTIDDSVTLRVVRFYTTIKRQEDSKGRPATDPVWRIYLLLDVSNDKTITNWMCDPEKMANGKITLYKIGEDSKYKEIRFTSCFCFKMRDFFNAGQSFSSTFIGVAGKGLAINSIELEQSWPGSL